MSELLGVKINCFRQKQALTKIGDFLKRPGVDQVVTVNPEFIVKAQKDILFKQILNEASLATADGVGVSLACKKGFSRVTGVNLIWGLAEKFKHSSVSFFLFGGKKGVAKEAAARLQHDHPGLDIAGVLDGYPSSFNKAADKIANSNCDILLVGLGGGKQEKWIKKFKDDLGSCKVAVGVGGAFDMLSGRRARAPALMRQVGLEWLWRLIIEPSRTPRILKACCIFPYLVIKEEIFT